jgi:tRNA U54 and U55 pseudouridine synthase Pus10
MITSEVVYVHDLKLVDKQFFDELKEIENSKAKSYCCVVWVKRRVSKHDIDKLNDIKNLKI